MIDSFGLLSGAFLLVIFMIVAIKGWMDSRRFQDLPTVPEEGQLIEPCPKEFVSMVFSHGDWEFVHGLKSRGVERLFAQERKKAARVWIRQTSALVRKAISEHALAARQSKNLEFVAEIHILTQFLILVTSCEILSIAIQTVGPVRLSGLAQFAQRLSQQANNLQGSFRPDILANARESGTA